MKHVLPSLCVSLTLLACGGGTSQAATVSAADVGDGTIACPAGEIAAGRCYASHAEACEALDCPLEQCDTLDSEPPYASCMMQPCTYMVGEQCFALGTEACVAAACTDSERCDLSQEANPIPVRCVPLEP